MTQIQAAMKLDFPLSLLLLATTAIGLGGALPQPKAPLSYSLSPTSDVSHSEIPTNPTYSTFDSLTSTRDTQLVKRSLSQGQLGAIGFCTALGGPLLLFLSFTLYKMSSRSFWVRGDNRAVDESAGLMDG
jgi:hypothetical protein